MIATSESYDSKAAVLKGIESVKTNAPDARVDDQPRVSLAIRRFKFAHGEMSAEPVAPILQCAECRGVWLPTDEDRWRCYLDTDDQLAFYCPHCAAREDNE